MGVEHCSGVFPEADPKDVDRRRILLYFPTEVERIGETREVEVPLLPGEEWRGLEAQKIPSRVWAHFPRLEV